MELEFLGTGSFCNTKLGSNSAYLKEDKKVLLFDCGESTFTRMIKKQLHNEVAEFFIIITHPHTDHIGSINSLIFYNHYVKGIKSHIICDDENKIEDFKLFFKITGIPPEIYDFMPPDEVSKHFKQIKNLKLIPIYHSPRVWSQAIHIQFNNDTKLFYTGDMNDDEHLKEFAKLLKEGDRFYCEACGADHYYGSHTLLDKLAEAVPQEKRKQVWCMHIDSDETAKKAKQIGFNIADSKMIF